tara:strand:+ start:2076 stop:2255 length:180 start_codon:yes stop_codon:yes gene_type:complete
MEKMSMFREMIEFNIQILSFRLVSKYYDRLNYEAVILLDNQVATVYYQGIDGFDAYCLN